MSLWQLPKLPWKFWLSNSWGIADVDVEFMWVVVGRELFPIGILQIPQEVLTKPLIIKQILGFLLEFYQNIKPKKI